MPRAPKPWYRKSTGWWMAQIGHEQHKLAKGRKNLQAARDRLNDLLAVQRASRGVGGQQTILSLVDLYLEHAASKLGERTYAERYRVLRKLAGDCRYLE